MRVLGLLELILWVGSVSSLLVGSDFRSVSRETDRSYGSQEAWLLTSLQQCICCEGGRVDCSHSMYASSSHVCMCVLCVVCLALCNIQESIFSLGRRHGELSYLAIS